MIDIESEHTDEFETWYTTEFAPKLGANRTMEFTIKEILRVGWLAAKADTVVVTEEKPPCTTCHCAERAQQMLGDPKVGVYFPSRDFSKCGVCGSPLVLHFWDRPGGPPGNGYGPCEVCAAALNGEGK